MKKKSKVEEEMKKKKEKKNKKKKKRKSKSIILLCQAPTLQLRLLPALCWLTQIDESKERERKK